MKNGQALLSNYSMIKKDDVRNNKIRKFSNGGQDNLYLWEKQYEGSPIEPKDINQSELASMLDKQGLGQEMSDNQPVLL